MASLLEALLVVSTLFTGLVKGNCPVHGCTPVCSYTSDVQYVSKGSKPRLAWSYDLNKDITPSGSGCVTNGFRIICPITSNSSNEMTLVLCNNFFVQYTLYVMFLFIYLN